MAVITCPASMAFAEAENVLDEGEGFFLVVTMRSGRRHRGGVFRISPESEFLKIDDWGGRERERDNPVAMWLRRSDIESAEIEV